MMGDMTPPDHERSLVEQAYPVAVSFAQLEFQDGVVQNLRGRALLWSPSSSLSLLDDLPVVIDTRLDVSQGLVAALRLEEMREPALALQVLLDGRPSARPLRMYELAADVLFQRPDTGLDRQSTNFDGVLRVVVPAGGAGC
jgi:hypothetical protein